MENEETENEGAPFTSSRKWRQALLPLRMTRRFCLSENEDHTNRKDQSATTGRFHLEGKSYLKERSYYGANLSVVFTKLREGARHSSVALAVSRRLTDCSDDRGNEVRLHTAGYQFSQIGRNFCVYCLTFRGIGSLRFHQTSFCLSGWLTINIRYHPRRKLPSEEHSQQVLCKHQETHRIQNSAKILL